MEYPIDCDSPRKRIEYLYRAGELLRNLHNIFSRWSHEGELTQEHYNMLPKVIKNKYIYTPKFSAENLDKFMKEDFIPRSDKIGQGICIQRAELKESTCWLIDVGEI